MQKWEKYLAIALLSLIVFILTIFLTLYLSRNFILHQLIKKTNKSLLIKINFDKSRINILKSYPFVEIHFKDLCITGKYEFENDTLVYIPDIKIIINTQTALKNKSEFTIQEISASQPEVNLLVNKQGLANYYLFPTKEEITTSAQPFFINIQSLRIFKGKVQYIDYQSYIKIYSNKVFGLFRNLKMSDKYANFFLSGIFSNLLIQHKNTIISRYTTLSIDGNYKNIFPACQDNYYFSGRFKLNQLSFSAQGIFENSHLCDSIQYHNYHLKINANTEKFKDLISIINIFYQNDYSNLKAKGKYSLNIEYLSKKDEVSDTNIFKAKIKIKNGYIKYPYLTESLDKINLSAYIEINDFIKGKIDYANFQIDKDYFWLKNFYFFKDKKKLIINGKLNTHLNLAHINKIIPISDTIKGEVKSWLTINTNLKDIEKTNFKNFYIQGFSQIKNLDFQNHKYNIAIKSQNITLYFTPSQISINSLNTSFNEINFNSKTIINAPVSYTLSSQNRILIINNLIDIKELDLSNLPIDEKASKGNSIILWDKENIVMKNIINIKSLKLKNLNFNNTKAYIVLTKDSILINSLLTNYGNSKIKGKAKIYIYDNKAFINFYNQIENINFQKLEKINPNIDIYAPILNKALGSFNVEMGGNFYYYFGSGINLNTIDITGNLTSSYIQLPPNTYTHKLAKILNLPQLDTPRIENLNLYFHFANKSLTIPQSQFFLSGRQATIEGYTSWSGLINYKLGINLNNKEIPQIIHKTITGNENFFIYITILGHINSPQIKLSTNIMEAKHKKQITTELPLQKAYIDSIEAATIHKKYIKKQTNKKNKLLIKQTKKRTRQIMRQAKKIAQELMDKNTPEARKQAKKVIRNARKMKKQLIKQANQNRKKTEKLYKVELDSLKKKLKLFRKRKK